jgi:MFS family permease
MTAAKKKPFYGWWIVSMGVLGNAFQGGFIFWTMGIYTSTFEDEFQAPRAQINLIETFLSVTTNLMSPLMGVLIDRWSPRHLMAIGVGSLGLGLIVLSQAGTLLSVWAAWATLIPLAALGLGVLPSAALISRWFRKRRGLALGLSVTGSSMGGALVPPLMTFLFMSFGWRTALLWSGIFCLLFVPVFLTVLRNFPEDMGLEQEEDHADPALQVGAVDARQWTIPEMLRTESFWWQTLIAACLLAVTLGTLANLSLHAKDLGITGQRTALLYSVIAFCSFSGKIVMGHLMDRIGLRRSGWISAGLLSAAMMALYALPHYPGLLLASVILGFGFGGVTPLWSNMPARTFGARSIGRALGVQNPLHIPITASAAPLAGWISDTQGSYDGVFIIYTGLCAVAAFGLYRLRIPRPGQTPRSPVTH